MGQELECSLRYGGRTLHGKAYLESDHLLFRGEERIRFSLRDLANVRARGGVLAMEHRGEPAELTLGAAAEKWAAKILHPPSRLDKLGVKPGTSVTLAGSFDEDFVSELTAAGARPVSREHADIVFLAAGTSADLQAVGAIAGTIPPHAALWVIYPKGITIIREVDVIAGGRAAGLKDVKVAAFSSTHTALKFVLPLATRATGKS